MVYEAKTLTGELVTIGSIYCIGRSYAEHAVELNNPVPQEPVIFLKSAASLRGMADQGRIAFPDETFHHEAEVVLVIGKSVTCEEDCSWNSVSHVALGLDLTRREVQQHLKEKGLPWTTAKSFLGSAVLSPLVPVESVKNKSGILFQLTVNDELRQDGDTSMMLFKVEVLLKALLKLHPLEKGDVIYTGTPRGVGPLKAGDRFQLSFTDIPEAKFSGVL